MQSTWVVGDIHGCARELELLLEQLQLQPGDRLLSAGDLFHRGPDPVEVLRILQGLGDAFAMVLGNHEWAMMKQRARGQGDRLRGDNKAEMDASAADVAEEVYAFLEGRPYWMRESCKGPAWEGETREWLLVHGSMLPGRKVEEMRPRELVRLSRCLDRKGAPLWHEAWEGPEFVVFGHAQSAAGLHLDAQGNRKCWGLDTGCVYGNKLTALRLEDLQVVEQSALA
ncbi:MAG: metallophosphoesterase [Planctomycetota bacterium]